MATVDRSVPEARTRSGSGWWEHPGVMRALVVLSALLISGVPLVEHYVPRNRSWNSVADGYSVLVLGFVLLALVFAYRQFLPSFARYLLGHLGQATILVLLLLLVWGQVGVGLGIPNLIWDENPFFRSASALGATLLLALLGMNAYYLGINPADGSRNETLLKIKDFMGRYGIDLPFGSWLEPDSRGQRPDEVNRRNLSQFLRLARLPFLMLISLPALFPRVFYYVPWDAPGVLDYVPWGAPGVLEGPEWIIIKGDIRTDPWAYLFGLFMWGSGLLLGVLMIKILLRVSSVLSRGRQSDLVELADHLEGRGRVGRRLAAAARWLGTRPLGGFEHYLLWVLVVYAFLALASPEGADAHASALFLLMGIFLLVLSILFLRHESGAVAMRIILLLCLLTLCSGWAVIEVPPSFAIFALLGLLATANVIYERRDARPVYVLFVSLLLALIVIFAIRSWEFAIRSREGERVSAQEWLALAALIPVFGFGLAQRYAPRPKMASERRPYLGLMAALALFALTLLLQYWTGSLEPPAALLAALFCFLGCCALWPASGHETGDDRARREKRRWILLTSALVCWMLLVNYDPFKQRFRRLRYDRDTNSVLKSIKENYPYEITETRTRRCRELLENRKVLDAWKDRVGPRWTSVVGEPRPKLVIVCVSGGAIRSAYWAATVLERLGGHDGLCNLNFHEHVRLITGASGGMVGMSYYVLSRFKAQEYGLRLMSWGDGSGVPTSGASLVIVGADRDGLLHIRIFDADGMQVTDTDETKLPAGEYEAISTLKRRHPGLLRPHVLTAAEEAQLLCEIILIINHSRIPPKSLNPVARFIALQSPWRMLLPRLPGEMAADRGQVLESDWSGIGEATFAELRETEEKGAIPSLIFSPMIVEDGRRLLISNLDLMAHRRLDGGDNKIDETDKDRARAEWPIPVNRHNDLDDDNDGTLRNTISISALELFKLIDDPNQTISLATAARMSATFPFVSPAVNLPTDPPLRIVDAGYYDNYGVHLANAWILQNREWLRCNTSGVLVVQIRDSVSKRDRLLVPSESRGFLDRVLQGAQLFSSVGDALLRAHYSTNTFRNDQEFIAVNEVFRKMGMGDGFVATVVFENTAYLTANPTRAHTSGAVAWPGLEEDGIGTPGSDVPMSWYLTRDEKRAIERTIPSPPHDRQYTSLLQKFNDKDYASKFQNEDYKLLQEALKYERMLERGRRSGGADGASQDLEAERLHEHFVTLGAEPAIDSDISEESKILESLSEKLYRHFVTLGAEPAIDSDISEESGTRKHLARWEQKVLLLAHSDWINEQAGFGDDPESGSEAADRRAYYTREFERVMNYHRLEAVRSWWRRNHAEPAGRAGP